MPCLFFIVGLGFQKKIQSISILYGDQQRRQGRGSKYVISSLPSIHDQSRRREYSPMCMCSPALWGPLGPTFYWCSPSCYFHPMMRHKAQFYTHVTISYRWIGSKNTSMVKMLLNFKVVKSRARIMSSGSFIFHLCSSH